MEETFKKIVALFNELSANDLIEIHEATHFPQEIDILDDLLIKYQKIISEKAGIEFNDDDIKILSLTSLEMKWQKPYFKDLSGHIYGGASFSIYGSLCGDQDEWLRENPLSHPQELVDNLYAFNDSEIVRHMSQKGRGCFYREPGKWPLDIYFFDKGVRIKMDMSLEEYIQALIDSCAIAYWQYFYVDIDELVKQNKEMLLRYGGFNSSPSNDEELDSPRLKYLIQELDIFVANLPLSFPEKDFSYHQNRLAQIKEKAQPYL